MTPKEPLLATVMPGGGGGRVEGWRGGGGDMGVEGWRGGGEVSEGGGGGERVKGRLEGGLEGRRNEPLTRAGSTPVTGSLKPCTATER